MKKIPIIIRIILTLLLVYGIYTETGIWTALSLFLVFVGMEVQAYLTGKLRSYLSIKNIFGEVFKK